MVAPNTWVIDPLTRSGLHRGARVATCPQAQAKSHQWIHSLALAGELSSIVVAEAPPVSSLRSVIVVAYLDRPAALFDDFINGRAPFVGTIRPRNRDFAVPKVDVVPGLA